MDIAESVLIGMACGAGDLAVLRCEALGIAHRRCLIAVAYRAIALHRPLDCHFPLIRGLGGLVCRGLRATGTECKYCRQKDNSRRKPYLCIEIHTFHWFPFVGPSSGGRGIWKRGRHRSSDYNVT